MNKELEKNCGNCIWFIFRFEEKNRINHEMEKFGHCAFFNDETQIYNSKDYCINHLDKAKSSLNEFRESIQAELEKDHKNKKSTLKDTHNKIESYYNLEI